MKYLAMGTVGEQSIKDYLASGRLSTLSLQHSWKEAVELEAARLDC